MKRVIPALLHRLAVIKAAALPRNINTRSYWNGVWRLEGPEGRGKDSALVAEVLKIVPDGSAVLEFGCGNGRLLRELRDKKGCSCLGLDISDEAISMLRREGIAGVRCTLPQVPFTSGSFDAVLALELLEHLDRPKATLRQMEGAARPGGLILFSVPDGNLWGRGGEHVHVFDANDCVQMLRPFVATIHVLALESGGWAHFLCWGWKRREAQRP